MSISMTDLKVKDVSLSCDQIPVVGERALLKEALESMTRHRLGIACLVDREGMLRGVFTDGDIRRMLLRDQKPFSALFADDVAAHANPNPTTVSPEDRLVDAVRLMEEREIWDLPVKEPTGRLSGLLHLHPAVKALLGI